MTFITGSTGMVEPTANGLAPIKLALRPLRRTHGLLQVLTKSL